MQARYFVLEPAAENGHGAASRAALAAYAQAIRGEDPRLASALDSWNGDLATPTEPEMPLPEERVSALGVLELMRMASGRAQKGKDGANWAPVELKAVAEQTRIPLARIEQVAELLELGQMYKVEGTVGFVRMEDGKDR